MRSSDRRRRRDERAGQEPASTTPAPPIEAILALQRTAGNRALQRLIYNSSNYGLHVPDSYGTRNVTYNGVNKTLAAHANDQADESFSEHLAAGLHVRRVDKVTSSPDATMRQNAGTLVEADAQPETAGKLGDVAVDHNRLLDRPTGKKYRRPDELDIKWVLSDPGDFVPGANDLPGPDADLKTTKIAGGDGYYWEYACVLIALVKLDPGLAKTQALLRQRPASEDAAVQALHAYYVRRGTQYDDTSTRFALMDDWGYTPVFTGRTTWADLPLHTTLTPQNQYIFDIEGHTVKVDVNKTFTGRRLNNPASFMTPESHPANYKPGTEFAEDIKFVWMKTR